MLKATIAAALAVAGILASPASAQWGFGMEVGPRYYGPPPVYYDPPAVYRREPRGYFGDDPVILRRVEPRVLHMEAAEDVLEDLDDAGFREFSPIRRRGNLYLVNAVDPDGNLVALEISIFTGEIERARVLEASFRAPPEVRRVRRPAPVAAPRRAPRPAPVAAARAAPAPAPAAATPEAQSRPAPPAAPNGSSAGSTLRDRLNAAPEEPAEGEPDPLVVY